MLLHRRAFIGPYSFIIIGNVDVTSMSRKAAGYYHW